MLTSPKSDDKKLPPGNSVGNISYQVPSSGTINGNLVQYLTFNNNNVSRKFDRVCLEGKVYFLF